MLNEQSNAHLLLGVGNRGGHIDLKTQGCPSLPLPFRAKTATYGVFLIIKSIKNLENPTSESAFISNVWNLSMMEMCFQSIFKTF